MRIYVASSWRNQQHPGVVRRLRLARHDVYDFRNPRPGDTGFNWSEVDPLWKSWSTEQFISALTHPLAANGFHTDMEALGAADVCVLVMPCGRSAHLEFGWAVGRAKLTIILSGEDTEPELMYGMADRIVRSEEELIDVLEVLS